MYDSVEKLGNSVIQHGKQNNRIYLMKLDRNDFPDIIMKIESLGRKNHYTKIFVKVPEWAVKTFEQNGYQQEACIPGFYNGQIKVSFMGKYLDIRREKSENDVLQQIEKNIDMALSKHKKGMIINVDNRFQLRKLTSLDIPQLTRVYKAVFDSYPFPIYEHDYIQKTMNDNIIYFGAFQKNNLIAASSAETDPVGKNVEMTDFATLPEFRGNSLAILLLKEMEAEMKKEKFKTAYTIARALSPGMNITFSKMNYRFTGTLINNTNISGNIESMNVWYKKL